MTRSPRARAISARCADAASSAAAAAAAAATIHPRSQRLAFRRRVFRSRASLRRRADPRVSRRRVARELAPALYRGSNASLARFRRRGDRAMELEVDHGGDFLRGGGGGAPPGETLSPTPETAPGERDGDERLETRASALFLRERSPREERVASRLPASVTLRAHHRGARAVVVSPRFRAPSAFLARDGGAPRGCESLRGDPPLTRVCTVTAAAFIAAVVASRATSRHASQAARIARASAPAATRRHARRNAPRRRVLAVASARHPLTTPVSASFITLAFAFRTVHFHIDVACRTFCPERARSRHVANDVGRIQDASTASLPRRTRRSAASVASRVVSNLRRAGAPRAERSAFHRKRPA
jgi:hypothetical protein